MKMLAKIFLQWRKTEVGEEGGGHSKCKILANFSQVHSSNNTAREEKSAGAGGHSIILKFLDCMAKF